ncbi:MAG TPA: T9SS type A sorting domain-containing protein [Paludibacter sp.]
MKKLYSFLIFGFALNLFGMAQTVLPYEKELMVQYNLNLATTSYYYTMKILADNSKANVYAFVNGSGNLTYNSQTITANGSAGILLQFKTSTGELVWSTSLGNAALPLTSIESAILDPNGNICIAARGTFQAGVPLTLGSQTFAFRTDMIPNMVFATFNTSTRVWSKVKFMYVPTQQGFTAEVKYDKSGNFYVCGTVSSSLLYIDNTLVASVGTVAGTNIYAYKENPQGTVVYNKQTLPVNPTGVDGVIFELDNSDNLFITGYISYITGAIGMDGVVVKNDTLSNKYDYSYTDIFLYKINSTGTVQFGKTYLYKGTEYPRFLHALSNGTLYLCGDYSGQMNSFPGTSGDMYYNRFIANISGTNGTFNWSYPVNSNVYYQDRFAFNSLVDNDENIYFSTNFCPNSINFMGQVYPKRNNKNGTSNTLAAKVSSAGVLQWGNVLGPVTTFLTDYIDNPSIQFGDLGTNRLILQVNRLSTGTNTDFAWGSGAVPTTTMPTGYGGNMAVVSNKTGDIVSGYYQKYTETIQIDSVSFFAFRNNFQSMDIALFKPQAANGLFSPKTNENELIVYPNPVRDVLFIKNLPTINEPLLIYSLEGKLAMKLNSFNEKVSVKDLPNGIYTIRVGERYSRFVKTR